MTAFLCEALAKHDRSAFTSGNERIDCYFALVEKASAKIAGFYTLSSQSIPLTELPAELTRKLPRYPSVPTALIGRPSTAKTSFSRSTTAARIVRRAIDRRRIRG